MHEVINKAKSNTAAPWATYQIPILVYEALSNWQAPYSTGDIMLCIKAVLNIDFNNPSAETYRKVNNIRIFIHSLGFKNPQQWQKKSLLSQFFGNEIKLVKRSEAFKELDKALEELLEQLAFVCNLPSATDNWLVIGTNYAFNAIGQLCNLVIKSNAAPKLMFKFFVSTQLLLYFAQDVNGQLSNTTALTSVHLSPDSDAATSLALNNPNFDQPIDGTFHTTDSFTIADNDLISHAAKQKAMLSNDELAALIEQANTLLDTRKFDEALKVAEQIASCNVNHSEVYFIKGSVYLEKEGNYKQAERYYAKACKLNPNDAKYQLFHKTAQYFNSPHNTLKHYDSKVAFDPLALSTERFVPNENLFCMADENNFIAASCRTNVTFNKNQANNLFKKADNQHEQGNLTEAMENYDKILAIIPHNNPYYNSQLQYLYWQKSLIHFSMLQYQQAKRALESVMVICTQPVMLTDVYFQYGNTLLNLFYQSTKTPSPDLAILERAALSYRKASQLNPNNHVFAKMHEETQSLFETTRTNLQRQRYRM